MSVHAAPSPVAAEAGGSGPPCLAIPGLEALWRETRGDERIRVAVLDGPVDRGHPSLRGARLLSLEGLAPAEPDAGPACRHGTHIASILFGQPAGPVPGVAPGCRGILVPIFESVDAANFRSCPQLDLARALTEAVLAGAHVINISGGEFAPGGMAHPLLAEVVRDCARRGVLIVAAAGNDGCDCLHVPAALEAVLAVGAMNAQGEPLAFSNWGPVYQSQGVLAPGEHILGAQPGGGVVRASGTSYATALVSGVAALLLSWQLRNGQVPHPQQVRTAILAGARARRSRSAPSHPRTLLGPLNVRAAVALLTQAGASMSECLDVQPSDLPPTPRLAEEPGAQAPPGFTNRPEREEAPRATAEPEPTEKKSSCGCGGSAAAPRLVYALGQVGYDFPNEARLDSFAQQMAAEAHLRPERGVALDPRRMLHHLERNPWNAAALEWTLSLEGTTLYAIRPQGPFAVDAYRQLGRFLKEQLDEGVERVSVPGVVRGKALLLNGQVVPVIVPELRGMYSWTTKALTDAVAGANPGDAADGNGQPRHHEGVHNFLTRVYHEVRNLGLTPQDRALNHATTNAFALGEIFASAIQEHLELDHVAVVPSPISRPGSDCWDVEVYFFYPERQVQTVRKVYRFTVDVSDTVPVTVGTMRSWFTR